jgi:hypothetical protein
MPIILATPEDGSLKPAWANSWEDLILKKPITRKAWWCGSSGKVPVQQVLSSNSSTAKN